MFQFICVGMVLFCNTFNAINIHLTVSILKIKDKVLILEKKKCKGYIIENKD